MVKENYAREMPVTAACSLQMAESTKGSVSEEDAETQIETNASPKDTYLGDLWFTSIPSVVQMVKKLGVRYIGVMKTSYATYPKKFIEETMENWPAGSHLVLETKKYIKLLAIGYKYNKRKVTMFLTTKDAGHTDKGLCYKVRWKDKNNNTNCRQVPRCEIVSKYFGKCNKIDSHNQSQQNNIKLEKQWVTEDGFFVL